MSFVEKKNTAYFVSKENCNFIFN